jgi:hypothetical protein
VSRRAVPCRVGVSGCTQRVTDGEEDEKKGSPLTIRGREVSGDECMLRSKERVDPTQDHRAKKWTKMRWGAGSCRGFNQFKRE